MYSKIILLLFSFISFNSIAYGKQVEEDTIPFAVYTSPAKFLGDYQNTCTVKNK